MIFFKKDTVHGVDLEPAINNAVFPGLQVNWECPSISSLVTILIEVHGSYAPMDLICICLLYLPTFVILIVLELSREVLITTQLED